MLLLMMQTKHNAVIHLRPLGSIQCINELHYSVINRRTVAIPCMIARITRHIGLQDKSLEEPGGMRQVPFRWTHTGHRLDHIILDGKGLAESMGHLSHIQIVLLYV